MEVLFGHKFTVLPARAGMSLPPQTISGIFNGVPRASGDEPAFCHAFNFEDGCSPRERG